jgi:hypothetical protein
MGIYFNRGLEYLIVTDCSHVKQYIVDTYGGSQLSGIGINGVFIIRQSETDDRLVKTKYYMDRKTEWFNVSSKFCATKISNELLEDFILSDSEKDMIAKISRDVVLKDLEHGWYDVTHVTTSYGW